MGNLIKRRSIQMQMSDFAWIDSTFDNFSSFELKLGILLGLQQYLLTLANKLQALLGSSTFCDWLKQSIQNEARYVLTDSDISIVRLGSKDQLCENGLCLLEIEWPFTSSSAEEQTALPPGVTDYQAYIDQLVWLAEQRKGFLLIEHVLLLSSDNKAKSSAKNTYTDAYYLIASLIFPAYVSLLQKANFKDFLNILLDLHWPAHIQVNVVTADYNQLKKVIPAFVAWHNCLTRADALNTIGQKNATRALIQSLNLPTESQS